ncbi:MAG TPA: Rne/Rng family ribonuclease, partial [Cryptosporangiaceae bacterium]|nr:Rne/Rng family ribonuclease [Cryptosporangiaceae bacterium]
GHRDGVRGNVYLGKVQNVLPSMEAAFVDIGKGRNAVLYAGEVNWDAADDGDTAEDSDRETEPAGSAENGPEGADDEDDDSVGGTRRRRRRRRRGSGGTDAELAPDDPPQTVVRVREPARERSTTSDEVQGVKGSTRLEAKRQRRREGRESHRRRPPVLTEAEFLARREAVERVMVVRQVGDRTQIAVLEDDILVEHYVTRATATAYAGNVYLGKVQNVLPSMEAAFVDIGKGRNAVLYAGEVNWDAAGLDGRPRKIETALRGGDAVLVQVTKDPIGHKGARLTSQISLPGRFLVYVPESQMTGISRKLPDTERKRLKDILKQVVPEEAGVIIRTAAEGASEQELTDDVARLQAQWDTIKQKAAKASAPALLYAEPDLVVRVIRDVFNEDFTKLVVSGGDAWQLVESYVSHVSPDLAPRLVKHTAETDVFAAYRVAEQLAKALDRKVWLPSGGSLVIDRTEAMTVVDVNTGKFTGQGGNLEETVTRNNLEAAEEVVRQLRLRDIGGMIVIDFIDMVLEANRELVLRRLTECLGRDRTKHQVAEVTSLGLVQMTRKRVGQGLLESFSETCEHCRGRGLVLHTEPVVEGDPLPAAAVEGKSRKRGRRSRSEDIEPIEAVEPVSPAAARAALAAIHAASHARGELEFEPTPDVSETPVLEPAGVHGAVADDSTVGADDATVGAPDVRLNGDPWTGPPDRSADDPRGDRELARALAGPAPDHAEPDLVVRVIRDVFNEDF